MNSVVAKKWCVACIALIPIAGCTDPSLADETTRDDSGDVVEGGDVGAFRLRVGDCAVDTPDDVDTLVSELTVVPCEEPHTAELYWAFDLDDGAYPGEEAVTDAADDGCLDAFETFVGTRYEESVYGIQHLKPTHDSWDELGDREVLCLINMYEGGTLTGSARGSAK